MYSWIFFIISVLVLCYLFSYSFLRNYFSQRHFLLYCDQVILIFILFFYKYIIKNLYDTYNILDGCVLYNFGFIVIFQATFLTYLMVFEFMYIILLEFFPRKCIVLMVVVQVIIIYLLIS